MARPKNPVQLKVIQIRLHPTTYAHLELLCYSPRGKTYGSRNNIIEAALRSYFKNEVPDILRRRKALLEPKEQVT